MVYPCVSLYLDSYDHLGDAGGYHHLWTTWGAACAAVSVGLPPDAGPPEA